MTLPRRAFRNLAAIAAPTAKVCPCPNGPETKNSEKSTFTKSAPPIAPPGCPELAFSTIEAARIRMLSAARFISFFSFILK